MPGFLSEIREERCILSVSKSSKSDDRFRKKALFDKELLRACGIEIAKVCGVNDVDMRAQCALGAIEVKVAVGRCRRCRQVSDEIPAEAVAAPHTEFRTPVVGERLLIGACARHGQDARNTDQRCDDSLRETRFGEDEHLATHGVSP